MNNLELQQLNRQGLKFHINEASNNSNWVYRTLENRGINNIEKFRHPHSSEIDFSVPRDCFGLIDTVNNLAKVNKRAKILILTDQDVDGFMSAAIFYNYLCANGFNNLHLLVPEGKTHGPQGQMDEILRMHPDVLLLPDSSSNDRHEHKVLEANGINFLIFDHHELSYDITLEENSDLIGHLTNNNAPLSQNFNSEFTGAGMSYLACKLLDQKWNVKYADDYLYLFAIGQIADASDTADPEIHYLVLKGLKQMDSFPISLGLQEVTAHDLSFGLIPQLNSASRVGNVKEKTELMELLTNQKPKKEFKISKMKVSPEDNRRHKVSVPVEFPEYVSADIKKLHNRQNNFSNSFAKKHDKDIVDHGSYVMLAVDELKYHSLTGLIAMRLVSKYRKPALVLWLDKKENMYHGSGRGIDGGAISDFKTYCQETGLFSLAEGHPNAMGVSISAENLTKLPSEMGLLKEPTYEVDYLFENAAPTTKEIRHNDHMLDVYLGSIKQPSLGFMGLKVYPQTVSLRGRILQFRITGTLFNMYNTPQAVLNAVNEHLSSNTPIILDCVGTPMMETRMKYPTPQINIDAIALSDPLEEQDEITFDTFVF